MVIFLAYFILGEQLKAIHVLGGALIIGAILYLSMNPEKKTVDNQYRVYLGLKMGVGDANRLAEYIAANANKDVNVDELAEKAIEEVL